MWKHLRSAKRNVWASICKIYRCASPEQKIIPLFAKYPIGGIKLLDYKDFCEVANIMKDKGHLTTEGRDAILKIKDGMNTGRIYK